MSLEEIQSKVCKLERELGNLEGSRMMYNYGGGANFDRSRYWEVIHELENLRDLL